MTIRSLRKKLKDIFIDSILNSIYLPKRMTVLLKKHLTVAPFPSQLLWCGYTNDPIIKLGGRCDVWSL